MQQKSHAKSGVISVCTTSATKLAKEWHLYGSKLGLLGLAKILDSYAANPANIGQSEHEHLGPHTYFTLTTWPVARLDEHGIWGVPQDLHRLANHLRGTLVSALPGQVLRVKEKYTPAAEYALCMQVEQDLFDPARLDPQLAG